MPNSATVKSEAAMEDRPSIPAPLPVVAPSRKPGAVVLLDTSLIYARLNFRRIAETISEKSNIIRGYHVTVYPDHTDMNKVLYNLPHDFVPIYRSFASPDTDSEERKREQRAMAIAYSCAEATAGILYQILTDSNHAIRELHAIINSEVYVPLIERARQADVAVHMYTPNRSLLRLADEMPNWHDFEQNHTFHASQNQD